MAVPAFVALFARAVAAEAAEPLGQEFDDLDLGSLLDSPTEVWTASKTEQNVHDAPAIITTITRDQIAVWGYRSVAEILSHLLGFYVVDDHVAPNLAVRGISGGLYADSSIVKVLVDGHSVAFHSTGGNWLGPELVPLTVVERIEVVRGPASALFGADAFLGVINIQTRAGKGLSGGTVALGGGVAGEKLTTDVDGSVGFERAGMDFVLSARRMTQDLSGLELPASSPAPARPAHNREGRRAEGLDQQSIAAFGRFTWRPQTGRTLGAFAHFSSLDRGAEFGSLYQLVNGRNQEGVFSENRVSLWQARVGGFYDEDLTGNLRLSVKGQVFHGGPRAENRIEVDSELHYIRREFSYRGGDLEGQLDWTPAFVAARKLRLSLGASLLVDDEELPSRISIAKQDTATQKRGDIYESLSVRQGDRVFVNAGAFVQGLWSVLPAGLLSVTGGVRYDQHNVYGGQHSERVGIVSSPTRTLHAKLLYGTAFKAPSPLLLHAVPSAIGDVTGNPQLEPQYMRTLEFQLAGDVGSWLNLSSNVAYSILSNKTEFVQQGINRIARNVSRATTLSWESRAEVKYHGYLRGYASYELQRTLRRTGQEGYTNDVVGESGGIYPARMLHAGIVAQPPRTYLRANVTASHIGARRASDTNILLNAGPYELPAYLLLDAGISTVGLDLFGSARYQLSFGLRGKNLLGARGPTPGFTGIDYPLAPRTFLLDIVLGL